MLSCQLITTWCWVGSGGHGGWWTNLVHLHVQWGNTRQRPQSTRSLTPTSWRALTTLWKRLGTLSSNGQCSAPSLLKLLRCAAAAMWLVNTKLTEKKLTEIIQKKSCEKICDPPKSLHSSFLFRFSFVFTFPSVLPSVHFMDILFYYSHDKLSKNISKVLLEEVISGVFIYLLLLCLKVSPGKHTVKMKGASLLLLQHSWFIAVCD